MSNAKLLPLESLEKAAECLRVLAHPQRLRMVELLLQQRLPVGEVATLCGIPANVASEHLRLMQRCGFLSYEREGRQIFYAVVEPHLKEILDCIQRRFGD